MPTAKDAAPEGEKVIFASMSRIKNLMKKAAGPHARFRADAVVAVSALWQYVALRWLENARRKLAELGKSQISPDTLALAKERDEALAGVFPYQDVELLGQGVRPIYTDMVRARNQENAAKREAKAAKRAEEEAAAAARVAKSKGSKRKKQAEEDQEAEEAAPAATNGHATATKKSKSKK